MWHAGGDGKLESSLEWPKDVIKFLIDHLIVTAKPSMNVFFCRGRATYNGLM